MVNLNGQLDYFGRTVNKASRVQSVARSNELSVSEEVFADPASKRNAARRTSPTLEIPWKIQKESSAASPSSRRSETQRMPPDRVRPLRLSDVEVTEPEHTEPDSLSKQQARMTRWVGAMARDVIACAMQLAYLVLHRCCLPL